MNKQHGGTAIEFAVILPLLVMLVFGIIEFGVFLYDRQVITNASREGARYGIVQADPRMTQPQIETVVTNYTSGRLYSFASTPPDPPTVAVSSSPTPCTASPASGICTGFGDCLSVTVSYNYSFLVIPAFVFGTSSTGRTITATTVMKCE